MRTILRENSAFLLIYMEEKADTTSRAPLAKELGKPVGFSVRFLYASMRHVRVGEFSEVVAVEILKSACAHWTECRNKKGQVDM